MARFTPSHRKDSNHDGIVATLERCGATVIDVHNTGCGVDIFVGFCGRWIPVEIKSAKEGTKKGALTDSESKLQIRCRANRLPHEVIRNEKDLHRVVAAIPMRKGKK